MPNAKETMSPELIAAVTEVVNNYVEGLTFNELLTAYQEIYSEELELSIQDLIEEIFESANAGDYLEEGDPEFESTVMIGADIIAESLGLL